MSTHLVINDRVAIPRVEITFTFARSSGPGGQNVNKVNSKALLRWKPAESTALPPEVLARLLAQSGTRVNDRGELMLTSDRYRDQGRNIQDCLDRLRALVLAATTAPRRRRPTKPTRSSVETRLRSKRTRSDVKRGRGGRVDEG